MRKKRDDENGDRIDQFGSYIGPAVVTIVALVDRDRRGDAAGCLRNCRNSVPAHRVTASKL